MAAVLVLSPSSPARAVPPTSPDCRAPHNHRALTDVPWHVSRYAARRVWPVTDGAGVTVAVIDSGVDASHPQLRGAVLPGSDLLNGQPNGSYDCVGHGTGVASIIAARPVDGVGFVGLAPAARILPIVVSERVVDGSGGGQGDAVDPAGLATAITTAVDAGAKVINLSVYSFVDDPRVRAAVASAVQRDVVVVAAVGNAHATDGATKDQTPYPAAYDGVIGVGAVDQNGARVSASQVGPFVDLVAPGSAVVVAASRSGDQVLVGGTSFAAPHVAAAAALLRSRWPRMTAAAVERRLRATAGPGRGGPYSEEYGYGEVDPVRAVNEVDSVASAVPLEPPPAYDAAAAAARAAARARDRTRIVTWAVVGLALTVAVAFAAYVVPRGRRRRWRPGYVAPMAAEPVEEEGVYRFTLGAAPALAHPDRAETERYVQLLSDRRAADRGRGRG